MATNAIVKTDAAITPMEMIQTAIQNGAGIEQLEKLLELQLRWEANEAKKAYVMAMNAFKADPPEIIKNKHVSYDRVNYWHASLDNVTDSIADALSKHGISHSWNIEQKEGKIKVTCVLTHEKGHSERGAVLEGSPDMSGSKNAIQAIGSAVTYLQRYTLLAATGLAAKDQDNDGGPKMENLNEKLEWIDNCRNEPELMKCFKEAYKEAMQINDFDSMKALVAAKDARLKAING